MLNRHQRIGTECLQRECIAGRPEILGIKAGVVSLEELLYHVDDGTFTRPNRSVKHHKLLQSFGISGDDGSDAPFNLVTLLGRI